MTLFGTIIETILYLLMAVNSLYLLVFSLASLFPLRKFADRPVLKPEGVKLHRFALLIAAYREDAVIRSTVPECLQQDYPADRYDVVVISDHMQPAANAAWRQRVPTPSRCATLSKPCLKRITTSP